MDSKLKAAFSPRLRPGGNKTVLNTMFVYFTSGGCHYLREKKKNKKGLCIRFQWFSCLSAWFQDIYLWRSSDFPGLFYPMSVCRTSWGGRKLPKLLAMFWWHVQRVLASQLVIFGEQSFSPQVLSHSKSRSINCSCWPVPGQTWGMFFISQGQLLNLSSIGVVFFFDVSLSWCRSSLIGKLLFLK